MAFNFQTFKTRTLTALLFVIVMLTGLLWNYWSFLILFTVIHFGCWYEYLKLVEKIYSTKIDIVLKYIFYVAGFCVFLLIGLNYVSFDFTISKEPLSPISLKWVFIFIVIFLIATFLFMNKQIPVKAKWLSFAGLFYLSLSLALYLNIRDNVFFTNGEFSLLDLGKIYVCGIMFSIWINDTMAYLVGSFFGKTPLTKISPKKTWEGTIGGAALCILVIALAGYCIPVAKVISIQHWIVIPALCAIFGTIGDLFESKLKRIAGVKDSGNFMPGHGGFLDRFDSLLVAVPAVWVYVQFFIK